MLEEKQKKIIYLILVFFIGAFAGKVYETLFYLIVNHELFNTGTLFGPWIIIYGVGSVLLYFLKSFKKNPIILFLLSILITGTLEYFSGLVLDKVFGLMLWNYNGLFLNIGGYVCFRSVITFAIGGLLLHYLLIPILDKIFIKIKYNYIKYFTYILVVLFIIDFILSKIFKNYHLF